jgi:hypothetical protein
MNAMEAANNAPTAQNDHFGAAQIKSTALSAHLPQ